MSQNFSKMPDIYVPELIQLDSYWQKAVEDAIYDTLEGEKRLYHALKNWKKISKKLKTFGLRSKFSVTSLAGKPGPGPAAEERPRRSSDWDSSVTSLEQDALSYVRPEASKSRSFRETSPEKRYSSPDRPLLGDGSLEKMKKSQNSFNCEPMGMLRARSGSEEEDFDCEGDEDDEGQGGSTQVLPPIGWQAAGGPDPKMIEWLHVREGSTFPESDTDGSKSGIQVLEEAATSQEDAPEPGFRNSALMQGKTRVPKMPKTKARQLGAPWWDNPDLDRRLQLALAKREIIKESLRGLRMSGSDSSDKIEIMEEEAKCVEQKRCSKRVLSPFIRFYLEVYRELCHKCPVKEIGEEASRRWWGMSEHQKASY